MGTVQSYLSPHRNREGILPLYGRASNERNGGDPFAVLQGTEMDEMGAREATCASFGVQLPAMTDEERIGMIYETLRDVSPYVRRSMMEYDMMCGTRSMTDDMGRQVVTEMRWMSAFHPYVPIFEYNTGRPEFSRYYASLSGMLMVGVRRDYVDAVGSMVWSRFLSNAAAYPVYEEDGTPITPENDGCSDPEAPADPVNDDIESDGAPQEMLIGGDSTTARLNGAPIKGAVLRGPRPAPQPAQQANDASSDKKTD